MMLEGRLVERWSDGTGRQAEGETSAIGKILCRGWVTRTNIGRYRGDDIRPIYVPSYFPGRTDRRKDRR